MGGDAISPPRAAVTVWDLDDETRRLLGKVATRNVGEGEGLGGLLVRVAEDEALLARLVDDCRTLEALNGVLAEAHGNAESYTAQGDRERHKWLRGFRSLPVQPSARQSTSVHQALAAVLGSAQGAGKAFDRLEGVSVELSVRDLASAAGLGQEKTARAALKAGAALGWWQVEANAEDGKAQTIRVASPWALATTMPNKYPTPISDSTCVRGRYGVDTVHGIDSDALKRSELLLGSNVLWSPSGFGEHGRRIYGRLLDNPDGLSIAALAQMVGVHRNTVTNLAHAMEDAGLVVAAHRVWRATAADPTTVARSLGLVEWRADRIRRRRREQRNYRERNLPPTLRGLVVDVGRAVADSSYRAAICPYFAVCEPGVVLVSIRASRPLAVHRGPMVAVVDRPPPFGY